MKLKKVLKMLLVASLVGSMLTGCGSSTNTPSTTTETTKTEDTKKEDTKTEEAQTEETSTNGVDKSLYLNLHLPTNLTMLDPALTSDGQGGFLGFIFDGLLDVNKDFSLTSSIAESWEVNDDATVFTFKLVEGVKFHDGTPCDAEAIKWNYERQIPENATPDMPYAQTVFNKVASIEAPDPTTVIITLSESDASFPTYLAMSNGMGIVSPTAWQADPEGFQRNPIGTGPYKFVEWVPDEYVKVVANEDYFKGEVQNAGVNFKIIKDTAVVTSEFLAGSIDYMAVTSSDSAQVAGAGFELETRPAPSYAYFVFADYENNPIFSDIRVRQAMYHAINMEAVVNGVFQGRNVPATSYIPPIMIGGETPATVPAYDVAKAEALLDEAGYPLKEDGTRFEFSYISRNESAHVNTATAVQMELAKIGVKMNITTLQKSEWLEKGAMEKPDYDCIGRNWGAAANDTSYMAQLFTGENAIAGGLNIARFKSDEFDSLVAQARTTGDKEKQAELYAKSAQVLNDETPIIWYEQSVDVWASQSKLVDPEGRIGWYGINYWWQVGKTAK